jgi:hypothetical protein
MKANVQSVLACADPRPDGDEDTVDRSAASETLCDRLLDINAEALAFGQFNVPYHALAAAVHCAKDAQDEARLLELSRRARNQIQEIDRRSPGYEHSTVSAGARDHDSIWEHLERQAEIEAKIVVQNRNQRARRGLNEA